eukprot:365702-Chlamydomonas_euryale.AAC.16
MLDPKKLTAKTAETINAAVELAKEEQQQQLSPLHLAVALYDDPNGGCMLTGVGALMLVGAAACMHTGERMRACAQGVHARMHMHTAKTDQININSGSSSSRKFAAHRTGRRTACAAASGLLHAQVHPNPQPPPRPAATTHAQHADTRHAPPHDL